MRTLAEPMLDGLEEGSRAWFEAQQSIIASRPLVRRTYERWYSMMLDDANSVPGYPDARVLEIGSGSGYVKTIDADVITSDIVPGNADLLVDAQSLPFEDESLRGILLTHVFHHIPDVRRFLHEAARTIVPGGVISMIEIARTPVARLLFDRFDLEDYSPNRREWALDPERPLGGANQALAWIVFERDRNLFESEFPKLKLECIERLPWLGYLCSGGVTRRNLIPTPIAGMIAHLDEAAQLMNPLCALHSHIRIRKLQPAIYQFRQQLRTPAKFHCPSTMNYICQAGPRYDGPTGWGTPNGLSGF